MRINKLTSGTFIILFYAIGILFSIKEDAQISLLIIILSSVILIIWAKNLSENYITVTVFFIIFSVLYGISGPINALWGDGLPGIFSRPYAVKPFLISYSYASIGLIVGIMLSDLLCRGKYSSRRNVNAFNVNNNNKIIRISIILALIGSIFEVVNIIRIGGMTVLFTGKANCQSLITSLSLTLPSFYFINFAFAFLGLSLGRMRANGIKNSKQISKIILFIIVALPFLAVKTILGQRGQLLNLFIFLLVGITFYNPMKRIKPKVVVIVMIFYVFMSFLYCNRGIVSLIQDDPSLFMERAFAKERLVEALNPGSNEFGAAFGNYSEFYNKYNEKFTPRYGETYLKGMVVFIPSFMYPGTKPIQIGYEFRNEFFKSEAKRGAIAGTGFSSILEAYINLKNIGVFLVYTITGFTIYTMDKKFRGLNLFKNIIYITIFSCTISFHRSGFGNIISEIIINLIILEALFIIFRSNNSYLKNYNMEKYNNKFIESCGN